MLWLLCGCVADRGAIQTPIKAEELPIGHEPSVGPSSSAVEKPPSRLDMSAAESKKGERAYQKEKYRSAERHFRYALRLFPENLHALSGLGWTLYDSGRPDEAFPIFKRAQELYPKDGSTRRGLAYLLYRYGRTDEAKKLLGSLDKERWPELANIDDDLREREAQGLPPPKPPARSLKNIIPEIVKEVIEDLPGKEKKEEKQKIRQTKSRETKESLKKKEKRQAPRFVQAPSFHTMVFVPGGTMMGGSGNHSEVKGFRIDKFEVTNALYAAFVQAIGVAEPPFWKKPRFSGPHLPVVGVTWHEAKAYCKWAGKRLPTEKEWEFVARGRSSKNRYPWGDKIEERNAVFGMQPDSGGPKAVGRRPSGASADGVEDLSGNVWEWVEDPFRNKIGKSSAVIQNGVMFRTLRGGSWVNGRWAMMVDSRTGDHPERRLPVYGFRCAADAP